MDRAVGTVGCDDQIAICERLAGVESAPEFDRYAYFAALLMQAPQQVDAGHAMKGVVCPRDLHALMHRRHSSKKTTPYP